MPPGRERGIAYADYVNMRTRMHTRSDRIRELNLHISRIFPITPIHVNNFNSQTNFGFTYERLSQLEDIKLGLVNKNLLNNSKVIKNFDNDNLCVICQDNIEMYDIIRVLKCHHPYHINCIDLWFTTSKKCPTCKYELD
jgi:hypothetical protein